MYPDEDGEGADTGRAVVGIRGVFRPRMNMLTTEWVCDPTFLMHIMALSACETFIANGLRLA